MSSTIPGGGVGTPVAPDEIVVGGIRVGSSAVPLCRYAALTGADECGFWGIRWDGQNDAACGYVWQKYQRDRLARALAEAQTNIERLLKYPITPTWMTDRQPYGSPVVTRSARLIQFGKPVRQLVSQSVNVDYSSEPAVIGPIATTANLDELVVEHESGESICVDTVKSSGSLTRIYVPRCRLLKPELADNPKEGWDYNDLDNFVDTVVVARITADMSVQAEAIMRSPCSCDETAHEACPYPINMRAGIVDIRSMRWDGDSSSWKMNCWCAEPEFVDLYYQAGDTEINTSLLNATIRLAHTLLPSEPCGCDVVNQLWSNDMDKPEFVTVEQARCPFGDSNGAWHAYQQALLHKALRMHVLNSGQNRNGNHFT